MRLINADEIQYAKDWVVTDKIPKVGGYNAKAIYRVTKEEIDAMPTVDAVPVRHGRWKAVKDGEDDYRRICSCCGEDAPYDESDDCYLIYPHCPWCGARMDGKDGDNETD